MTNFTGLLQCFATILLHVVKTAGGVAQNQHQDQSSEVKYSALSSTLPFPSSTLSSSSGNDHQYEASSVCELVLPSMDSGGLIFFLHIPKTGGTTIRRNLEKVERVKYIFAKNFSTYYETSPLVEQTIIQHGRGNNNTILFYEIHATTAPAFYKLRGKLKRWRTTAKRNNVPVFFFSLIREPVAYSFSHFNFFHIQERNPSFERCNATETNFIRKSVFNPQCQFLYRGEPSLRGQNTNARYNFTVHEHICHVIQNDMVELMDWIGSTEYLSIETIPLLSKLLNLPASFKWDNFRVGKNDPEHIYFDEKNVSSLALQTIRDLNIFDTDLYNNVTKYYKYERIKAQLK